MIPNYLSAITGGTYDVFPLATQTANKRAPEIYQTANKMMLVPAGIAMIVQAIILCKGLIQTNLK